MTSHQFRAALDRLDISQVGFGRLLGYGERSPRRWASGEVDVPPAVIVLLRLLLAGKVSTADIEAARRRKWLPADLSR